MLAVANPPSLDSGSDFSDDSIDSIFDSRRDSCSSVDTTFSDIPAAKQPQCACCAPVLTTVTAQGKGLSVRDPRAELSYILGVSEPEEKKAEEEKEEEPVELQTFSSSAPSYTPEPSRSRFRTRESRANSTFLRLYAHDTAARAQGRLPMLNSPEELALLRRIPALRRFDKHHDLARILALSCKKLWDAVVLPPRADPLPKQTVDSFEYVKTEFTGGLTLEKGRNSSRVVPWAPQKRWVRPAGAWPLGGQYTVKGWTPARLVPQTRR